MAEREYRTISLQIPEEMYQYLVGTAKRECASVSYLIRRMILESMRKEESNNG